MKKAVPTKFLCWVKLLFTLVTCGLLASCSTLDNLLSGEDNIPEPTPLVDFTPQLAVERVWSKRAGQGAGEQYLSLVPVVADSMVIVADTRGSIHALARATGNGVWRNNTGLPFSSGPGYVKGYIALGTNDARVAVFGTEQGNLLWQERLSGRVLAVPTVAHGIVLVKTVDDNLYAFNQHNGDELWRYEHDRSDLILHTTGSVQVAGDLVVSGFSDGKLVVLDVNDGHIVWERRVTQPSGATPLQRMISIGVTPVISRGVIYVASYQGRVTAINLESGDVLWQQPLSSHTGLVLSNQRLFITDDQSHVWAFNRNSGDIAWRSDLLEARNVTAPVVVGNAIVVGDSEGYLHWLSQANGEVLARVAIAKNDPIIEPPAVVGDDVYVLTASGRVANYRVG